jgi:putative glutamine amidotransferase
MDAGAPLPALTAPVRPSGKSLRPVIALCGAREQIEWGPWTLSADMLPVGYAAAVRRAGAMALMVPPDDSIAQDPDLVLDRVDGLMLAGGCDVDPAAYDGDTGDGEPTCPERDHTELALAARALERDMPLLGICRGMQVLNVVRGGALCAAAAPAAHGRPGGYVHHDVVLEPESLAARAAGANRIGVHSAHHQALGRIGDGLVVSGHSASGTVEAVEMPAHRYVLGVLWHPEQDVESTVVASFVTAARAR